MPRWIQGCVDGRHADGGQAVADAPDGLYGARRERFTKEADADADKPHGVLAFVVDCADDRQIVINRPHDERTVSKDLQHQKELHELQSEVNSLAQLSHLLFISCQSQLDQQNG